MTFGLLLTLLLALATPGPVRAEDYTEFLSHPDISVVEENGKPKIFPGGHDEKYWATDSAGNRYKLRLKNAAPSYAEIGTSILSDAMGLPTLPVKPILIKRGQRGVPLSDRAKALLPGNSFMGLTGARGEWFPATLQPVGTLSKFNPSRLTGKQAAELVGQLLLNGIVGNNDIQLWADSSGNIALADGHFVTVDATQAFKFYPDEGSAKILKYPKLFPVEVIQRLSPAERHEFLEQINLYLSRLERIDPADSRKVFEPYFRSITSFRKFKNLPAFDFESELRTRIEKARSEVISQLEGIGLPKSETARLAKPLHIPRPNIRVPEAIRTGEAPVDKLWSFYFQDFWKARADAEQAWSRELGVPAPEAIARISEQAGKDTGRIYDVSITKSPDMNHLETKPQLRLNPRNPKTLVVVPLNDLEARTIASIAQASGAKTLVLPEHPAISPPEDPNTAEFMKKYPRDTFPHGAKLRYDHAKHIVELAKRQGITDILVVELPGLTPDVEKYIHDSGIHFKVIDHHTYKDMDRFRPLSSLEQTARELGYSLSAGEKAIGVNDRAFLYGLADLGMDRAVAAKFAPPAGSLKLPEPVTTPHGKLYVFPDGGPGIGEAAGVAAIQDYPEIPSILIFDRDGIRFSGSPKIVEELQKIGKPLEGRMKAHYAGGDKTRSMFWGAKEVEPRTFQELESRVRGYASTLSGSELPARPKAPLEAARCLLKNLAGIQ